VVDQFESSRDSTSRKRYYSHQEGDGTTFTSRKVKTRNYSLNTRVHVQEG